MDYEALKEQWSEVEDRDGVRLSWNVFPSSRMVCLRFDLTIGLADNIPGSFKTCGSDRSTVHSAKGVTRRHTAPPVRACHL